MDIYSNGQTRYNNLMNQFNNPLGNEDDEAFKMGQMLGNLGKAYADNLGKASTDSLEDVELTGGSEVGANDIMTQLGTKDPKKLAELARLAAAGGI